MKKMLILTIALSLMLLWHPGDSDAQELTRTNIGYLGVDHDDGYGVTLGIGFTIGKGSLLPYARFSADTAIVKEGEVGYSKTVGIEFAWWMFEGINWKLGLLGDPANIDWVQIQGESEEIIIGQALGLIGTYNFAEQYGIAGWVKLKSQWFDESEVYGRRLSAGLAVFGVLGKKS